MNYHFFISNVIIKLVSSMSKWDIDLEYMIIVPLYM